MNRKYVELFLGEAAELLDGLSARIREFETSPLADASVRSALRLAHTLKGGAKMVGLDQVSRAAHDLESALQRAAAAGRRLEPEEASRFLGVLDGVRAVLSLLAEGREGAALARPVSSASSVQVEASESPHGASPAPERRLGSDRVRVGVGRLDELQNLADDLVFQAARVRAEVDRVNRVLQSVERDVERLAGGGAGADKAAAARVAAALAGLRTADLAESGGRLEQLVADAHGVVLDLRMVPLAEVLEDYQRLVRDLGRELGKEVGLEVDGTFTEVDKRLLEQVQGPLTHLLRNAVDHGIEAAPERTALGKPAAGRIALRAYHKGGAVVIEVEDDGRGLDPRALRQRAVQRGLLGAEEAASLSDDDSLYLVCRPGFTTRAEVTSISGRGVGMDAVRSQVEKLNGALSIQSRVGEYSRFRLFLPLFLSRLPVLVARAGDERVAIPSVFVNRCLAVDVDELARNRGSFSFEGRLLPVVSLQRVFGGGKEGGRRRCFLVALRLRGRHMLLQLDEVEEEREIVIKPVDGYLARAPYVLGFSFLREGLPLVVLNVLDLHARWAELEAECRWRPREPRTPPLVLVVDDSVTARHLEQTVLQSLGYRVLTATDGLEAWTVLESQTVDLVLTDVDMPVMDGLELARRIRSDPAKAALPVVAVSNRSGEGDREAGLRAGMDAYLPKDRFVPARLGEMVADLLARRDREGAER